MASNYCANCSSEVLKNNGTNCQCCPKIYHNQCIGVKLSWQKCAETGNIMFVCRDCFPTVFPFIKIVENTEVEARSELTHIIEAAYQKWVAEKNSVYNSPCPTLTSVSPQSFPTLAPVYQAPIPTTPIPYPIFPMTTTQSNLIPLAAETAQTFTTDIININETLIHNSDSGGNYDESDASNTGNQYTAYETPGMYNTIDTPHTDIYRDSSSTDQLQRNVQHQITEHIGNQDTYTQPTYHMIPISTGSVPRPNRNLSSAHTTPISPNYILPLQQAPTPPPVSFPLLIPTSPTQSTLTPIQSSQTQSDDTSSLPPQSPTLTTPPSLSPTPPPQPSPTLAPQNPSLPSQPPSLPPQSPSNSNSSITTYPTGQQPPNHGIGQPTSLLSYNNEGDTNRMGREIPVCRRYLMKLCPFGKKGTRRGRKCRYNHPVICYKEIKHGKCERELCNKFHPPLCQSSITSRTCYDWHCEEYHMKGTHRTNGNNNGITTHHFLATEERGKERKRDKEWRNLMKYVEDLEYQLHIYYQGPNHNHHHHHQRHRPYGHHW